MHHTECNGSWVHIDQALEKEKKKTAKSRGGVIGITKKKEIVTKWNLLKEKSKHTDLLGLCENEWLDEYSLHQEFSTTQKTKEDGKDIRIIKN